MTSPASITPGQHGELPRVVLGLGVLTPVSRVCYPIPTCAPCPSPASSHSQHFPLFSARPVQLLLPSWSHRALDCTSSALPCVLLHSGAPHPLPGPIPGTSSPGICLPQPGSSATSLSPGWGMGAFSAALVEQRRGMLLGIFPYRGKSGFQSLQSLPHHDSEALPALGKKQLHSPVSC